MDTQTTTYSQRFKRILRTDEQKVEILERQKKSGQTISTFCKENRIHPTQFYSWKRKFWGKKKKKTSDFLQVFSNASLPGLEICLPSGLTIKNVTPQNLNSEFLKMLMTI